MRRSNEQSLKDVISEILGEQNMQDKLTEVNVVSHWEEIAGALIFRQTEKIYIHDRKLFLHITSPPLRQELNYTRSKMVEIVNTFAGKSVIDDVVVR